MKNVLMVVMVWLVILSYGSNKANAQDATVIEVGSTDAARYKQLYNAKVAAEKAWDGAVDEAKTHYTESPSGLIISRAGYEWQFSGDFRFLVEKQQSKIEVSWLSTYGLNCNLVAPTTWPSTNVNPLGLRGNELFDNMPAYPMSQPWAPVPYQKPR